MMRAALVLALVIAPRLAEAQPCRVTALLEGDGELVDSIARALARRGIATTASPACPAAKARLDRRGTAIAVTVIDPDGRESERTLADLDAATAVIESWARQDLNSGLLFGWTVDAPPSPPVEPPPAIRAVAPPSPRPPRVVVSAAGELSSGGGTWTGAAVHACVRIGPVCAGAIGRVARDEQPAEERATARHAYDALVAIELPLAIGRRVVVAPGAGFGAGMFQAPFAQDAGTRTITSRGTRLDGHLAIAVALGRSIALYGAVAVGHSFADPTLLDGGEAPRFLDEPTTFARGAIGLRIGVP